MNEKEVKLYLIQGIQRSLENAVKAKSLEDDDWFDACIDQAKSDLEFLTELEAHDGSFPA